MPITRAWPRVLLGRRRPVGARTSSRCVALGLSPERQRRPSWTTKVPTKSEPLSAATDEPTSPSLVKVGSLRCLLASSRQTAEPGKAAHMFSTIVVGTDGSESASTAVTMAIELARKLGADIHLVHVVKASSSGAPVTQVGSSIAVLGDPEMSREVQEAAHAVLVKGAATADGVTIKMHFAAGSPADALTELAAKVDADLIVVGSKGMQGTRRLLGSIPNSVAHGATCSVLIAKTV
jgi:nucleotide-binding universal stress UspA family protein